MRSPAALARGAAWLVEQGVISIRPDSFGPSIYTANTDFHAVVQSMAHSNIIPITNFAASGYNLGWLKSALKRIADTYVELGISEEDFAEQNRDWEPIPLDPDDPRLQAAIEKLDQTIEEARASNGYAAAYPEERKLVIDSLSQVVRRMKEDTAISVMYVWEFALKPLGLLTKRFGLAALGVLGTAAKESIIDWVKQFFDSLPTILK